jgi:predicted ATPase/class 3 adenylate cyclase
MLDLPTGTVTFLFTDIEGSTGRWEAHPKEMRSALLRHDAILQSSIEQHNGHVFKTVGDAFCAAFSSPADALQVALTVQRALHAEPWDELIGRIAVRMALHTGVVEERGGDYFGQPVNRVARLLSSGHGGQTLLSQPTYDLVRDTLPSGVSLQDMGEHRLKDLIRPEHIYQLVMPDLPSQFPPLKTLDNRPNNLPRQTTALIGREKEIDEVCTLLLRHDTTLLTLTGPGGIGKTRLGLQAAADLLDDFSDGVWFVELSTITEPRLVLPTIAQTLGVKEAAGQPIIDTLKSYLKEKRLLLLLDNFEQVAEAAGQVGQLLAASAGLKVLSTSRIPLRIKGEKEYSVPPLGLPDIKHLPPLERLTQYEAVRLFIERAADVKADFQVTNENAPSVAEICIRLDGLPLAIELAAARIKMLPPHSLLVRLSQRLRLLTGGARNLHARQQTLRNTIEWSYDLLDDGQQHFFRRMASFSGGRTLEALEAVCNYDGELQVDVFDGAETMLSNSLLQQREGSDGEPRFWMLETIHEYAREKLEESGEAEALGKEHAIYFMRLAEEAEPHLLGIKQQEWLNRLEDEHDNIRYALKWAREQTERGDSAATALVEIAEIGLRTAGALWRFWQGRGYYSEGREELEGLLSAATHLPQPCSLEITARALIGAGIMALRQGDYSASRAAHKQALSIGSEVGDKKSIAIALLFLGVVSSVQGDYPAARSLLEESLAQYQELGDKWGIALALNNLGDVYYNQADYPAARSLFEQSLAIRREIEDKSGIAYSLQQLGLASFTQGDYPASRSLFEQGLALFQELGDKRGIALSLISLGLISYIEEDYSYARSLYKQGLALFQELGDKHSIAVSLAGLGGIETEMDQVHKGATLLGACQVLLEAIGAVMQAEDRIPYERGIASARSQLGEEAFEKAWAEGRAMTMEQAIAYALEESDHD